LRSLVAGLSLLLVTGAALAQTPRGKPVATPTPAPAPPPQEPPPPPPPRVQEGVTKITLEQALLTALAHNPIIRQARVEIASRAAGVNVARAPFDNGLTVGVDFELTRSPAPDRADGQIQGARVGGHIDYLHRLPFGTGIGVSLAHRYADSPGVLTILAPQFTTDLRATVTQPVLRGFGSAVNEALIGVAQTLEQAARLDAQRTAHEVLANVALAYWNVAQSEEEVAIRQRVLDRAHKVMDLTNELIKRGSLPQAAEVQARSTVALRRARLDAVERVREEAQSALVRAILDKAPVRITSADPMPSPTPPPAVPAVAAAERVDVRAAGLRAQAQAQQTAVAEDQVRPALDLSLFAGLTGLGGTRNDLACQLFTQPGLPAPAGCVASGEFDGYGKTWSTLFGGGYYTAGIGATLFLPLQNEGAEGVAAQARIAVDQAKLAADALRRGVEADVVSLRGLALSDRRVFETAEEAKRVTLQLIDIEEQRYKVGSATTFDVLRVQDDLAEAESLAASARAAVLVSDVRYQLAAGRVLEHLGVKVEE